MPIQIQEINEENGSSECPLCMEPFEADDINFFPCVCGYQVCRFCWHRIRTDENGLCPACRTSYPENPVEFRPLTESDMQKIRHEKRQKEVQRRQKITDCRRHLAAIRVLQKNLVFVVGLSQRLSDTEVLKRSDYFGKYGRILKIVVNTNTAYAGSQGPSASAYITYSRMEEALRAIQSVNNIHVDGRTLKASLGTTKYCSTYLKNQQCHKQDCMYLHELADEEASFTKEDMQAGKHQELEQRLIEEVNRKELASHTEPPANTSAETSNSTKSEKSIANTRSHASPWTTQQNNKVENSWLAGMPQTIDQSGGNKTPPAVVEAKSKEPRASPQGKQKKVSPRHTGSKASTPTIDTLTTDSSHASSECSSVPTTPPPTTHISTQNQDTRLPNNVETEPTEIIGSEPPPTAQITEPGPPVLEKPFPTKTEVSTPIPQVEERYNPPSELYTEPKAKFPSSSLLPSIFGEPMSQPLQDVMPIQSTNDWEAAFGFSKSKEQEPIDTIADSGDNDFGFDPWVECSKGLADLMEKESAVSNLGRLPDTNKPDYNQSFPYPTSFQTHNFPNSRPDQTASTHFGIKPTGSGFPSAFSHNFSHHHNFSSQLHQGFHKNGNIDANATHKPAFSPSPTKKLSEWQNGLRALLPSVNINFAMGSQGNQGTNANAGPNSSQMMHQNNSLSGTRRVLPGNQGFTSGPSLLGGYEESTGQIQSQSSFFPQAFNRNQSYFHNGLGLGANMNDRYNLAPPPGLNSSASYNSDPAIISSGSKTPAKPNPPVEETPHWMRSLQALVETDAPVNPPQNLPAAVPNTFSSWPSLSNSASASLGIATQPPPGFQTRLSDNNTMDYAIRQSLLENQS